MNNNLLLEYTQNNANNAYNWTSSVNNNNKNNSYTVVPFFASDHVSIEEVTNAYFQCRKKKRRKASQLEYELNYELNNLLLWEDLNSMTYKPTTSITFCVTKPKLREIFAANFRDRIVHHLFINKFNKIFESKMLNSAYACRKNKGTLYGVKDIASKLKTGKYIKFDISGFFMSINKNILLDIIIKIILESNEKDKNWWIWLSKIIILHRPQDDCIKKGDLNLWSKLPKNKSLFYSNDNGLPIGNLTSLVFANVYMSEFDNWMFKLALFYCRYVDDCLILTNNLKLLSLARTWLKNNRNLNVHPKKVLILKTIRGIPFIGYFIKGNCIFLGRRSKYNAMNVIKLWNCKLLEEDILVSKFNSYYGLFKHTNSYNFRKHMWNMLTNKEIFKNTNMLKISRKCKDLLK